MHARTWFFAGAALAGAALTTAVTADTAHAGKASRFIRCDTDRLGKFKTGGSGAQAATAVYTSAIDNLQIIGGSAKRSGSGLGTRTTTRVFNLQGTVPDFETRTDYPFTFVTSSALVNEASFALSGGTNKAWIGTNQVNVTITSFKDQGTKKGKHVGLLKGTFNGTVPVSSGDPSPIVLSNGAFVLQVVLQ
jgi:hypothetical protein